ncbi:MAG: serine hydrolase domain-containing protein, partial [Segetibacter sp.]
MKKLVFIVITFCHVTGGFSQSVPEKLNEYMQALSNVEGFNGAVLVAKDGNILLEKGYGLRNAEANINHDANSVFQIGSVTKQFTAAIILKLEQEGKLSIKDKLSKYFPQYQYADKITIENLLNHVSGIYNYTNDTAFMKNRVADNLSQEAFWNLIKDKPLDFEPGSKFRYSNSGFSILGYIIEKVTGKSYESVVRNLLFQPASMTHSGFDFTHYRSPDKSVGYLVLSKAAHLPAPIVDSTVAFSAGAIYSTVHDLYNWNTALNSGKIIPAAILEKAYKPFKDKYGYGFFIDSVNGKRRIKHGGGIHGFVSNLTYIPEDKTSIVMLSNKPFPLESAEHEILSILYNQPYKIAEEANEIKADSGIFKAYVGECELAPTFNITVE